MFTAMNNIATITTVNTCDLETEIFGVSDYINSNPIPFLTWASYLNSPRLIHKIGMIIVPAK